MRKINVFYIIFSLLLFFSLLSAEDVLNLKPKGFLNDYANVLDNNNQNRIEYLLRVLKQRSGIEFAVVTVNSIGEDSIEEAAEELFQKWGIGEKGKDNGLLFIIAVKERRLRFEVGYGLEEVITDGLAGRVRDQYTVPYLKDNKYDQGVYASVIAIISILNNYYNLNIDFNNKEGILLKTKQRKKSLLPVIFKLIFFLIIIMGGFGRFFPFFFFPFLMGGSSNRGSYHGGFGSGGGSFGGGFGGFGGGMSGGGGASGSF